MVSAETATFGDTAAIDVGSLLASDPSQRGLPATRPFGRVRVFLPSTWTVQYAIATDRSLQQAQDAATVAGEADDDDPAGLHAGDDPVAERGMQDVVTEPEAGRGPERRHRRHRVRSPPPGAQETSSPPSLPEPRSHVVMRLRNARGPSLSRSVSESGISAMKRLGGTERAVAEYGAGPRRGEIQVSLGARDADVTQRRSLLQPALVKALVSAGRPPPHSRS